MRSVYPIAKKLVFFVLLAAVAWASLVPQEARPQTGFWDGWEHLAAYVVLGISGLLAFPAPRQRLIVVCAIILYGITLEILQGFLPGRMPGLVDALANSAGVGIGYLVIRVYENLRNPGDT